MNLISTSWSCQRCGAAFISTPPEHGLCDQCLTDLELLCPAGTDRPPALPHSAAARCAPTAAKPSSSSPPSMPQNSPAARRGGERR